MNIPLLLLPRLQEDYIPTDEEININIQSQRNELYSILKNCIIRKGKQ